MPFRYLRASYEPFERRQWRLVSSLVTLRLVKDAAQKGFSLRPRDRPGFTSHACKIELDLEGLMRVSNIMPNSPKNRMSAATPMIRNSASDSDLGSWLSRK